MERIKKYLPHIFILALIISAILIVYLIYIRDFSHQYLRVIFLDVGQGDSIYIEAPNGTQMLIDGGPDEKVLANLSRVMPLGDRSINLLVATHADSDHIGGLPSVIDNYKIDGILENGVQADTKIYQKLEDEILNKNIKKMIARSGMKLVLDKEKNIYFEILFPDNDTSNLDSNDGSIVGKLVYGNESFLLTGDATIYSEIMMHRLLGENLKSNVLKLGHHGSRTSSSLLFLEDVKPEIAIISAGKNNRYGHPHQEILDRLNNLKIPFLNTATKGNILFKTDGTKFIH